MSGSAGSVAYRRVKAFWLFMQCLLLPMAALYLSRTPLPFSGSTLERLLLKVLGGLFLVLWLIFHSVLSMYRFPLDFSAALRLTLSQVLTYLFLWALNGFPLFSAYVTFFSGLAAIFFAFLVLVFSRRNRENLKKIAWFTPLILLCLLFLVWLFIPLWRGMHLLSGWMILFQILVLGLNTAATVAALWRTTVFAPKDPLAEELDKEWQRWAAPTIIFMILSAVAAAAAFGVSR